MFQNCLLEKHQSTDFVSLSHSSLNRLLKRLYVVARRKDKLKYTKLSQMAIGFRLCCFMKNNRPEIDIINGAELEEANRVLKAKL